MSDQERAEEMGLVGGQGRTGGDVYAAGIAAVWVCGLIAAALFAGLAWMIWRM